MYMNASRSRISMAKVNDAIRRKAGARTGLQRDAGQDERCHVSDNGGAKAKNCPKIQPAGRHSDVNAVAAHVGGEDVEQGEPADGVHKPAHAGEQERRRNAIGGAEVNGFGHGGVLLQLSWMARTRAGQSGTGHLLEACVHLLTREFIHEEKQKRKSCSRHNWCVQRLWTRGSAAFR